MAEQLKESFTVIFLGNEQPPTKLIMLKRASGRYGGDLYTGIGGHFEPDKDPTMSASAERELGEEVPGMIYTQLSEFARCIVNGTKGLYYFWGQADSNQPLPKADEREGEIAWIPVSDLFKLNIFPTTRPVLEEWSKRQFDIERPWIMYVSGVEDEKGVTRSVTVQQIKDILD